ncbi:MAG: hypothetical protein DHS20C21_08010 [Gemmatimonadota bacterium]|nr:MAG: hypothetical protein DHS20C21_08010 [Gemmatimonadota bacterium]
MRLPLALLISLTLPSGLSARTWYINADGTGDAPSVQAGVDSAAAGDTVELACGTYYEHDVRLISGITIRTAPGAVGCSTIDGQGSASVVLCLGVRNVSLVGLVVTGGGVGIRAWASTLAVSDCVLVGNEYGGLSAQESDIDASSCVFMDNGLDDHGGGASIWGAPTIRRTGTPVGSRLYANSFEDCVFGRNSARFGGAVALNDGTGGTTATFTRCVFFENSATRRGGAIDVIGVSTTLTSCTLVRNSIGDADEGTISVSWSDLTLTNSVLAFGLGGTAIRCGGGSPPLLICCDVYGNAGGNWVGCIADQYGQDGNISEAPLLCDLPGGDLTLAKNSPCLPANNSCGIRMGAYGVGCDPISVQPDTWARVKARYR